MKKKDNFEVEKGYFRDGLPYTRIGTSERILIELEAFTYKNAPQEGYMLKEFIKMHNLLAQEFTVYLVGRKPGMPKNYLFNNMADDYAKMIQTEFKEPVDIMGGSTGGCIAQYLGADHPDVVSKLVLVSTAYRVSEKGIEIERKAEELVKEGKYVKSLAKLAEVFNYSSFKKYMFKLIIRLFGKMILGKIEDPSVFLITVVADCEMNFKERLSEIKAPTLILSGELDICYTAEDVRETAEGIPNAKLILYEGYGHGLVLDNMEQVQKDILEFLKKD